MAQDFNRVCTGWWWVQGWFGQLHEKLPLDAKKTWQCLKEASTKPLVDVKTTIKINLKFKIIKPHHYFILIVQGKIWVTHKLVVFINNHPK